jgi:hypothetical protein
MKKLLIVIALLSLTGCKPGEDKAISLAQKEIIESAKDPDSVKFRYMRFAQEKELKDGWIHGYVCGQTDGKDSLGVYHGYSSFIMEIKMKPKGKYSTGVNYSVLNKSNYQDLALQEDDSYTKICGPNRK